MSCRSPLAETLLVPAIGPGRSSLTALALAGPVTASGLARAHEGHQVLTDGATDLEHDYSSLSLEIARRSPRWLARRLLGRKFGSR